MISTPNRELEIHIPFTALVAMLGLLGLLAMLVSNTQLEPNARWALLGYGAGLQLCAGGIWLLAARGPQLARGLVTVATFCAIALGIGYTGGGGFLFLLPLPLLTALALQGLAVAVAVALGETLLVLSLAPAAEYGLPLLALWLILLFVDQMIRPPRELATWAWQHYQRARSLLDVTRDHKADLQQALQDLMQANRQLDLINERLAAMRVIAEEASQAKAAFVAKVSHELRTPLNMIIGLIDLAVQTPNLYGPACSPALLEDLSIVQRNCTHLASMIDDVLDLSQSQAGRLVLHREWVDLRPEVEHAVAVVRPLLDKKQLALHLAVADDLPPVYCDRTRIRQVVLNLVSNAARYTARGGVTIRVYPEERALVVQVCDTGPGIAAADLERIFEPFYQASTGPWQERKGSGLGLSISKQFIDLHQGALWVESGVGQGSAFSFRLPFAPPEAPQARAGRWISEDWLWHERPPRPPLPLLPYQQRVILYDESGDLAAQLAQLDDRLEIVEAADFAQALQAAQTCPAHILIINTIQPSALWPLLAQAKETLPDTPVFGYTLPARLGPALAAGATHYLTKPVTRADLQQAVNRVGKPVRRVLVVDDDQDFRNLITRMLHTLDATLVVETAADGRQALHALAEKTPDLVFLDITMPEYDGWQVLRQQEQMHALNRLPITIISAQDPIGSPLQGDLFVAGLGRGLSCQQLFGCALALADLFLQPESRLDPTPG